MPKITKCGIFVKYNAKKSLKPLKTLGFRVLASASKLATLANKRGVPKGAPLLLSRSQAELNSAARARSPKMQDKTAAGKVAVFAKQNGRRCRQGVLQASALRAESGASPGLSLVTSKCPDQTKGSASAHLVAGFFSPAF